MSRYELIAFDMDGTLLDSNKAIREDSLAAIKKARQSNKIICLSTGRSMTELKIFGSQLDDVQYFIAVSGALIYDNEKKQPVMQKTLSHETVIKLFEQVKTRDVLIHLHSDKSIVQKDKLERMPEFNMGLYKPMFKKICTQPESIYDYYLEEKVPVYKLNIYSKTTEERQSLFEELKTWPELTLAFSEKTSIECSPSGITKGTGLKHLCRLLNIPLEKTIAVGDAENDLEILKTAGLAAVMGNASQKIKNVAEVVLKDNDSGGCAQAINYFLLK